MTPLSDRVVVLTLVGTVLLCFALAFWAAHPGAGPEPPLQWRSNPPIRT